MTVSVPGSRDSALTDDIIEAAAKAIRGTVVREGTWSPSTWKDYVREAEAALAAVVPRLRAHIADRNDAELRLTEGDLTVAVAEAQQARAEVGLRQRSERFHWQRANRLSEQRRAVLDLCDRAETEAEAERDPQSGLDGAAVVWVGDIRAALEAVT
jgi:hypothetical protein